MNEIKTKNLAEKFIEDIKKIVSCIFHVNDITLKSIRTLNKDKTTVQVSFVISSNSPHPSFIISSNSLSSVFDSEELMGKIYLKLLKKYCFLLSVITYSLPAKITKVVYFKYLHANNKQDIVANLGEGFNKDYLIMLTRAYELINHLNKIKSEIRWFYYPNLYTTKWNNLNYINLFRNGEKIRTIRNVKRPYGMPIPTRRQLGLLLLISNIFKDYQELARVFVYWKKDNLDSQGDRYNSPIAKFLKFVMFYKFNEYWDPKRRMWYGKKKTFKINDFLSLRLEKNKTNIYVNTEKFKQCKFLLFNISTKERKKYKNIDSIDEAEKLYDKTHETSPASLNPKTEFWGHCSNLQAWYENNYDTRLLHSNLSFPLLKKLTEVGDPLAEVVFKEEIISRLESEYFPIFQYLTSNGYLDFFKKEELKIISKNLSESILKIFVKYYRYFRGNRVILLNKNTGEDRKKIIFSNNFKLEVKEENNKLVDHGKVSIIFLNYQSLFNHFKTHSDYRYIWFSYKTIVLVSIERNLIELACKILGKKSKYVISTKKFNRPHPFFNSRKSMCSLTSRKNEEWFELYSPEKKIQISIRIPTYLEDHICE